MNSKEISEPGIGLSFTRLMPLTWQQAETDAGGLETEVEQIRNDRLLQLLLLYDDYPADRRDQEGEHTIRLAALEDGVSVDRQTSNI